MTKHLGLGLAGLVALSVCSFAQQPSRGHNLVALNASSVEIASLVLSDASRFSYPNTLSWIQPSSAEFLPALPTPPTARASVAAAQLPGQDSSKEPVDVHRNLLDYVHGEVGLMFGHSSGKWGGDVESGYVIGGVGTDKLQITAGASYENSTERFPRLRR